MVTKRNKTIGQSETNSTSCYKPNFLDKSCSTGTWSQDGDNLSDRHIHTLSDLVYDVVHVLKKSESVVVIHVLAVVKKRVDTEVILYQQH